MNANGLYDGLYMQPENVGRANRMSSNLEVKKPTMAEIKDALVRKGLRPVDYKHLNYDQLRKLAGV